MANLLELARMSSAVYNDADGVKEKKALEGKGWSQKYFYAAKGGHGFQAATFVKGGEKVAAFRGTAQGRDVVADAKLGAGINTSYFTMGEQYASIVGATMVTGHSLGGAIAQVVANRGGYVMASFNAPGVAVLASRNIASADPLMSIIRIGGMVASAIADPASAMKDSANAFRSVKGVNLCLIGDAVSKVGNHYGKVKTIVGNGINPLSEHGIGTVISV